MKPQLYLHYLTHRYGLGRLLALLLCLISLVWLLVLTLPERAKIAPLKQQVAQLAMHRQPAPVSLEPEIVAATFFAGLPKDAVWTQQLELLFDLAFEHDVYLSNVEYRQELDASGQLTIYKIVLPVSATYTSTRVFIQELLEKLPNAALDQIILSREEGKPEIAAKLQFTLYFRHGT